MLILGQGTALASWKGSYFELDVKLFVVFICSNKITLCKYHNLCLVWCSSSSPHLRQGLKPASCSYISTCLFWAQLLKFHSFQTRFLCLLVQNNFHYLPLEKTFRFCETIQSKLIVPFLLCTLGDPAPQGQQSQSLLM